MAPFEIWKPIDGRPYEVSSLGRVRSVARDIWALSRGGRLCKRSHASRIRKAKKLPNGYLIVTLAPDWKTLLVSRLVCEAFHGQPPTSDAEADHKNGVRDDNRSDNLEWLTPAANRARRNHARGSRQGSAKLDEAKVLQIKRELIGADASLDRSVGTKFGVSRRTVSNIRRGASWTHVQP